MKTNDSKVSYKSIFFISVLVENFGKSMNLVRIKFLSLFICALCKVQIVCFEKLASGFENNCDSASSLRRIQRFMADYSLDKDLIARLIFALLPHDPPYSIAIDRTNWKFGQTIINILVPTIVSWQGHVPAGTEIDFAFAFWDYLPIFAELLGQKSL